MKMDQNINAQSNWGMTSRWVSRKEKENRERALEVPGNLGLDLSPELKDELAKVISHFIADKTQFSGPPRSGLIKSRITKVLKSCHQLIQAIQEMDFISTYTMGISLNDKKKYIGSLVGLEDTAFKALKESKTDKGGRTPDMALRNLILGLADIYREASGKEPGMPYINKEDLYDGPFFRLVDQIITTLGDPAGRVLRKPGKSAEEFMDMEKKVNGSLAQQIRRILRARSKLT